MQEVKETGVNQRERLATGSVNMSHGDPLFRLMRALSAYWKKKFRVTAPGLRKLGYMSLAVLDEELKSFSKDPLARWCLHVRPSRSSPPGSSPRAAPACRLSSASGG